MPKTRSRPHITGIARPRFAARHSEQRTGDTWYRIEDHGADTAEIYVYDEIGGWGIWASEFVAELQSITAPNIDLHLNSPGGDVFDGVAMMNALAAHPATVTTYVDSLAASIASVIAMAGERIVMARNATMMIHEASGLTIGSAADHQAMADLLNKISDNIASVYADRTGVEPGGWREAMLAETWYTAQEAVDAGLADEVAPIPGKTEPAAEPDEPGQAAAASDHRWVFAAYRYAGRHQAPAPATPAVPRPADDLVWVLDESSNVCPVCQENADAGPIPEGDTFPSGHYTPPAHPRCACGWQVAPPPLDPVEATPLADQQADQQEPSAPRITSDQLRSAIREAIRQ